MSLFYIFVLVWIGSPQDIIVGAAKHRTAREFFTSYEEFVPRVFDAKGQEILTTLKSGGREHENAITVRIERKQYGDIALDLKLTRFLLPDGHLVKLRKEHGDIIYKNNNKSQHCYYNGHMRGDNQSSVAVSTCHGISGTIFLPDEVIYLEPQASVILGTHFLMTSSNHVPVNHSCGVDSSARYNILPQFHSRLKRDVLWPADSNRDTKIVECFAVNDNRQYRTYEYDVTKVVARTIEIFNAASALYKPLNIHIALVGIEIWTDQDKIVISEDAESTMTNFLEYRRHEINPLHKNDNAQLLTDIEFKDGVIGKAPIHTMCSFQYSGGVNMDHHALIGPVATTVAHEMGHNFGLAHDVDAECECPEPRCVMNRNSGGNQPKHWSSCSQKQLSDVFAHGMDYCLHDLPEELYRGPVCGNGFKEDGEQCDCGTLESCTSKCCNASTCTLFANATCATGACCDLDTCKLALRATPCRGALDTCDLGEYCHGDSEFCPADAYQQDGTPCKVSGQPSYCYKGQCRNHESQCQLLWGITGHKAADICYTNYNTYGRAHGHCGFYWTNTTFVACATENVMCGMLHCKHLNEKLMYWKEALSYTMPESFIEDRQGVRQQCAGAILDVGLNYKDPGMVPDGAKCDSGKICLNAVCTPLSQLNILRCPDCHGNGVCNNLGQCHCEVGYAPPYCDRNGDGGSKHSGPIKIYKNTTPLYVGLVVLFVVILPVLSALFYIVYRHRASIKTLFEQRTQRDKYRYSEGEQEPRRNGGVGVATTQDSSQATSGGQHLRPTRPAPVLPSINSVSSSRQTNKRSQGIWSLFPKTPSNTANADAHGGTKFTNTHAQGQVSKFKPPDRPKLPEVSKRLGQKDTNTEIQHPPNTAVTHVPISTTVPVHKPNGASVGNATPHYQNVPRNSGAHTPRPDGNAASTDNDTQYHRSPTSPLYANEIPDIISSVTNLHDCFKNDGSTSGLAIVEKRPVLRPRNTPESSETNKVRKPELPEPAIRPSGQTKMTDRPKPPVSAKPGLKSLNLNNSKC